MTVLLCPGQGAQYPGMGKELADRWPAARAIFDRADEALGFSLTNTIFEGTAEDVERTDVCQPGILTVTIAICEALRDGDVLDTDALDMTMGLSLGEYTAHVIAGSLPFEDAVRLVRRRGQYMQEASDATPSGMAAAIGISPEDAETVCAAVREEGGVVVVANLNAPGQVVVSGERGALDAATPRLAEAGARRVIELPVAGAFHSPVMEPAAGRLAEELAAVTFADPRIPVVSNVTAEPVTTADAARDALARQITAPVLFERSLRRAFELPEPRFIEPGPGKALTGFIRKIDRRANVRNLDSADDVAAALDAEREGS